MDVTRLKKVDLRLPVIVIYTEIKVYAHFISGSNK